MSSARIRAALAVWRRRERFRKHRHDRWQRELIQARKADAHPRQQLVDRRDKWTILLKQARAHIAQLERELAQHHHAKGVDVSNNNGRVDWRRIAKAGYRFAFVKATEGTTFNDAFLIANVEAARRAGLAVGAYHFLTPSSAITQADHFVNRLRAAGLGKGDLLPVVDVEMHGVGPAHAGEFVDAVHHRLGIKPLIYTFPAFARWESAFGCRLWIANFGVSKPTIPGPWKSYAAWQFSSTARVPGVSGNCDVNTTPDLDALVWD